MLSKFSYMVRLRVYKFPYMVCFVVRKFPYMVRFMVSKFSYMARFMVSLVKKNLKPYLLLPGRRRRLVELRNERCGLIS